MSIVSAGNSPLTLDMLVGVHELSGVDYGTAKIPRWGDEYYAAQTCSFILDGFTFTIIEDPDDGYRSHMRELILGGEVANTFPPQLVICERKFREAPRWDGDAGDMCNLLVMHDVHSKEDILILGTTNTDDYYPSFVAAFHPSKMSINRDK